MRTSSEPSRSLRNSREACECSEAPLVALGLGLYVYAVVSFDTETLPEGYGRVGSLLYAGDHENQPLAVGLGGAEGGNSWTRTLYKPIRDSLLEQGYAVLALAYFGGWEAPEDLDRISVEGVYAAIMKAAQDHRVNQNCIAIVDASKGAELALLLASHRGREHQRAYSALVADSRRVLAVHRNVGVDRREIGPQRFPVSRRTCRPRGRSRLTAIGRCIRLGLSVLQRAHPSRKRRWLSSIGILTRTACGRALDIIGIAIVPHNTAAMASRERLIHWQ